MTIQRIGGTTMMAVQAKSLLMMGCRQSKIAASILRGQSMATADNENTPPPQQQRPRPWDGTIIRQSLSAANARTHGTTLLSPSNNDDNLAFMSPELGQVFMDLKESLTLSKPPPFPADGKDGQRFPCKATQQWC